MWQLYTVWSRCWSPIFSRTNSGRLLSSSCTQSSGPLSSLSEPFKNGSGHGVDLLAIKCEGILMTWKWNAALEFTPLGVSSAYSGEHSTAMMLEWSYFQQNWDRLLFYLEISSCMEPNITARHVIFAWLHGEVNELQRNTANTFPQKKLAYMPSSNLGLHTSRNFVIEQCFVSVLLKIAPFQHQKLYNFSTQ